MIDVNAYALQSMDRIDQALCLLQIVALRSADRAAATGDVRILGEELALPPSSNLSYDLGRLLKLGRVVKQGTKWRIAPAGRAYLESGFSLPPDPVAESTRQDAGATIQGITHHPVPPTLAPNQAVAGVRRLLERTPWDKNVMMITRFPSDENDVLAPLIERARIAAKEHGMNLLVASDTRADDRLGLNVVSHMWAAKYGIALFEDRVGRGLNANVLVEVGAMIMTGRRVLIVRDKNSPDVPSDLTDHIYGRVDFDVEDEVADLLHRWFRADLGLGPCADCTQVAA